MDFSTPHTQTHKQLLQEVYGCRKCAEEGRSFARAFDEARPGFFYKFPPTIGRAGTVQLLFVGYNPRRTRNLAIHDWAMRNLENFHRLSENTNHLGDRYIGGSPMAQDREGHYDLHAEVVQRIFARPFEEVAAVTEMYLCASRSGRELNTRTSPCARRFLVRTIMATDPLFIITLGLDIPKFFARFVRGIRADVLHLPFPSSRSAPPVTMRAAIDWAVSSIAGLRSGIPARPREWHLERKDSDSTFPSTVMRY